MAYIYVERKDGKIARVEIPDGGDDLWRDIGKFWPISYDYIDEGMIVPGDVSRWDISFNLDDGPDGDMYLAKWALGGHCIVEDMRKYGMGVIFKVPREDWATIFSEGEFDEWDQGRDMHHPVQPGTFHGVPFEVEYKFEDGEEDPDDYDDDQYWIDHVVSIRWVRE